MAALGLGTRDAAAALRWAARSACAALALWACHGAPSRPLLAALVPAQSLVYQAVMPEHQLLNLGLQQQGAQLSLGVHSQTARYIVVRGTAYAPGVDFEASTPARSALLVATVVLLGGALGIGGRLTVGLARLALSVAAAVFLAVVIPPILLAGAQWGVAYTAFEDLSTPALLVGASDFLLHGGSLAIAVAAAWALRPRKGDRRMPAITGRPTS